MVSKILFFTELTFQEMAEQVINHLIVFQAKRRLWLVQLETRDKNWNAFSLEKEQPAITTLLSDPGAMPQEKASKCPWTKLWSAASMVSAPSQSCQGLQHMPPNPWCPLHNKNRPVNGARTLSVHPCQPQTDLNPLVLLTTKWLHGWMTLTQYNWEMETGKTGTRWGEMCLLISQGQGQRKSVLCCVATEVHWIQGVFFFF